jgi:hypothetical protein
MEIKIQIKRRIFSICFGHKTYWFEQIPFVTITEEFYNNAKEVCYANLIFNW